MIRWCRKTRCVTPAGPNSHEIGNHIRQVLSNIAAKQVPARVQLAVSTATMSATSKTSKTTVATARRSPTRGQRVVRSDTDDNRPPNSFFSREELTTAPQCRRVFPTPAPEESTWKLSCAPPVDPQKPTTNTGYLAIIIGSHFTATGPSARRFSRILHRQ